MLAKKIYLLEDDADIRELIIYFLGESGYKIIPFGTGKDFCEQLEKELPDLFILDVTLPDMNGLEISEKLLAGKDTGHIPVLIMSANFYNRQKAMESGVHEFISKPFDIDDLLSKVKALINN